MSKISLPTGLEELSRKYAYERGKSFAGSDLGNFVRHDLAIEAKKQVIFLPFNLRIKASVGAGKWAAVPWLGFFDPLITTSATAGFYVVYLINPQDETFYLSLNQGTTAVYREFGESRGKEVLRRRSADIVERVSDYIGDFSTDEIELGSSDSLPSGYCAGHAFGRKYTAGMLSEKRFYTDLERILYAYEALIDRGGITPTDSMLESSGTKDISETRKYFLSRRIERAPNIRKDVLKARGFRCEGCGLDPELHLSYKRKPATIPLDVHHTFPIGDLSTGESRRYRIPDDFLVLCPTCHRLIHSFDSYGTLDWLKAQLQFSHR